jgi:hypothetical protein
MVSFNLGPETCNPDNGLTALSFCLLASIGLASHIRPRPLSFISVPTHHLLTSLPLDTYTLFIALVNKVKIYNKQNPWPEPACELYWPSDRRMLAKLMPTLEDRGCQAVSVTGPYGRNLGFLDRSRYFFFQVAPQLYSRG